MYLIARFVPTKVLTRAALCSVLTFAPLVCRAESLDAKIDALAEQLTESDTQYKDPAFQKFSERTQNRLKLINRDLTRIRLYRTNLDELKREPTLTDSQLRWLVEIEDGFVTAAGRLNGARAMYLLADENNSWYLDRAGALQDGLRDVLEAARHFEKAKRDLSTLRTRVEMRQQQQ